MGGTLFVELIGWWNEESSLSTRRNARGIGDDGMIEESYEAKQETL
jgi:hypothetical protein